MAQLSYLSEKGNERREKKQRLDMLPTQHIQRIQKKKEEEHHFDQVRRTRTKKKEKEKQKQQQKKKALP